MAENKAAKQEADSSKAAAGLYAPYNNVGKASAQTLAGLLGIDPSMYMGAGGGVGGGDVVQPSGQPQSIRDLMRTPENVPMPSADPSQPRRAPQPGMTLAGLAGQSPQAAPSSYGQGTVLLYSPDGTETYESPAHEVDFHLGRGARRAS